MPKSKEEKILRSVYFPLSMKQAIQVYADGRHQGNFNSAVVDLLQKSLDITKLPAIPVEKQKPVGERKFGQRALQSAYLSFCETNKREPSDLEIKQIKKNLGIK